MPGLRLRSEFASGGSQKDRPIWLGCHKSFALQALHCAYHRDMRDSEGFGEIRGASLPNRHNQIGYCLNIVLRTLLGMLQAGAALKDSGFVPNPCCFLSSECGTRRLFCCWWNFFHLLELE